MSGLKATPEDVRHAYRLLLGREPDEGGFQTYCKLIAEQNVSASDVAAMIQASVEYKTRHAAEPVLVEIEFNGFKLYPWRGDSLIGGTVAANGSYEPHVLPAFVERVPVGGTVLDVGANIGIFTLSAAHKAGPQGRVFAIEPIARNVQSLCAGVFGNGLHNVSVFPVAASASAGVVPMLRNDNSSNGIVDTHVAPAMADAFAPTQPVHQLLQGLDRLDVIKIDIEGHEPLAWPSIEVLVRKHRPVVFTEFNPVAIRNHSRVDAELYLAQLFSHAATIETIEFDGQRSECRSVEEIMDRWRDVNRRAGTDGTCHLDLVADMVGSHSGR
jgi:FkbM family methyltransferase